MVHIKDFEKDIDLLESAQRHDLAVHLYLTHLLHRVNPLFPLEKWALWPQKTVGDPTVREDYEDGLLGQQNDYNEPSREPDTAELTNVVTETPRDGADSDSGADSDFKTRFFRPYAGAVRLRKFHRRKSHANAVLVNEMHALLQRRIVRKLAATHPDLASTPIMSDLLVLRDMALQMANRMGRVVEKLKQQRRLAKMSASDNQHLEPTLHRRYYKQNWQDVVTADLRSDDHTSLVDVKRLRILYSRCRKLFHEDKFKYKYDSRQYGCGEVPEFNISEHLRAIQDDPEYSILPLSPEQILADRTKLEAHKENLFINLWNNAGVARQLSYKRSDNPGYGDETALTELDEELTKALYKNGLRADDFEIQFKLKKSEIS